MQQTIIKTFLRAHVSKATGKIPPKFFCPPIPNTINWPFAQLQVSATSQPNSNCPDGSFGLNICFCFLKHCKPTVDPFPGRTFFASYHSFHFSRLWQIFKGGNAFPNQSSKCRSSVKVEVDVLISPSLKACMVSWT